MKALVFSLALLCGQFGGMVGGNGQPGQGAVAPVFKQFTYVNEGSAAAVSSITSPAITVASGDLILAVCRVNATMTSSLSTSAWTYSTPIASPAPGQPTAQIAVARMTAAGSGTFTCNYSPAQSYTSMLVEDRTGGTASTINAQATCTVPMSSSPVTCTTAAFTTTTRTLGIMCLSPGNAVVPTAGSIAGSSATIRGSSNDTACEEYVMATPTTSATASITAANSTYVAGSGTFIAISY